jgi:hypothetical protein
MQLYMGWKDVSSSLVPSSQEEFWYHLGIGALRNGSTFAELHRAANV